MGEWVEQTLTVAQREANKERLAVARTPPGPRDHARWGRGPSHVAPEPGDVWIDADSGRSWVYADG